MQAARVELKGYGIALDALTATLDTLDTYFGKQIYKTYNEQRQAKERKDKADQSTTIPFVSGSGSKRAGAQRNAPLNLNSQNSTARVSANQISAGSSYGRLVPSLNRLVASLSAYA